MAAILSKSLVTFLVAKAGKNTLGGRSDIDHILQRIVMVNATEADVIVGSPPPQQNGTVNEEGFDESRGHIKGAVVFECAADDGTTAGNERRSL